jgi:hypothetical protein
MWSVARTTVPDDVEEVRRALAYIPGASPPGAASVFFRAFLRTDTKSAPTTQSTPAVTIGNATTDGGASSPPVERAEASKLGS